MTNQLVTCDAIRKHDPCYDPSRHLPEDYSASIADFLRQEQIPAEDRIWVATRFLSDRTNRLFAVWCARQALGRLANPDPRSVAACDVAERYADGDATQEELDAACSAARSAAWSAAAAARSAAVATSAAWSAAESATSAAESAAGSAARLAAWSAAWSAESAAWSAWSEAGAKSAARSVQVEHLITLAEREIVTKGDEG